MTAEIVLTWPGDFDKAHKWIDACKRPDRLGSRVRFDGPKRSLDQNRKMWPMLTDISTQLPWHGLRLTPEDWKLLFLDSLQREMRLVPNLDGTGFVNIDKTRSSRLSKQQFSDLIELIYSFGASHQIVWSDPNDVEALRDRARLLAERDRMKRKTDVHV